MNKLFCILIFIVFSSQTFSQSNCYKLKEGLNILVYQDNYCKGFVYIRQVEKINDTLIISSIHIKVDSISKFKQYNLYELQIIFNDCASNVEQYDFDKDYYLVNNDGSILYNDDTLFFIDTVGYKVENENNTIKLIKDFREFNIYVYKFMHPNTYDIFDYYYIYGKGFWYYGKLSRESSKYIFESELINFNGQSIDLLWLIDLLNEK